MMELLQELNKEQRDAATITSGPVLVIAGPGTGKTKTLVAHSTYLVEQCQVDPGQILVLAFTKKTAEEIQTRIRSAHARGVLVSTFHALCYEILGSNIHMATDAERLQIIAHLPKAAAYKRLSSRELALLISRAKSTISASPAPLQQLVDAYDSAMREQGLLDFDDLLLRVYELLQQDNKTCATRQYSHILVDEFQDTNRLQYELLRLLCASDNLFVIGDPKQSIYGFRGASGGIFDQFLSDFPATNVAVLTVNYRSCPQIVAVGNATFVDSAGLRANKTAPGQVRTVQVYNEYSEANWVLGAIRQAIGGSDMLNGVSDDDAYDHLTLKDFAILYRNRSAAIALQKRIAESGLPYQVVGEGSPYEQPPIQAILSILRSVSNGGPISLPNISTQACRTLQAALGNADQLRPHEVAEKAIALLGFELSTSLQEFIGTLIRFSGLTEAVGYFDKIAETNFYDQNADAITLLTIHASKGLEFPYVFLLACEEDTLPYIGADREEEKRLFYVAVTRAKDILVILHATKRGGQEKKLSRFAADIDPATLPRTTDTDLVRDRHLAAKRAIKRSQQSLF